MRSRAALLALFALLFAAAAPAAPGAAAPDGTLRVLFIGNSYTYVNNVPALLEAVAAQSGGPAIETEMLVAPGARLIDFVEAEAVLDRLDGERWDFVVLQELGGHLACLSTGQRPLPTECTESIASHRKLAKAARRNGARVLLFGTWSMTENVQGVVSRSSRRVASMIDATLVDVGWMLERAQRADPALALFQPDRHLRPAGSVLAAIALWQGITGRRVTPAAFEAEVPVWPADTGFSLRRTVSALARRLPEPATLAVALDARQVATLVRASDLSGER